MGSKTVLLGKLALVFAISLLSFSVGIFAGKKYSDNQHQLAALEPGKTNEEGHGDAHGEAHGDEHAAAGHEGDGHAATDAHGDRSIASEASTLNSNGTMSDEEIAKLAEEFVSDDTNTVGNKDHADHSADHGTGHDAHAAAPAHAAKAPAHEVAKPAAAAAHTTAAPATVTHTTPPAAKLREHNPAVTVAAKPVVESRIPTSLPKDVGQYQPTRFTVQVASYTDEGEAKKMATDLKGQGYGAFYVPALVKGKTYYRVSVGQFATQQEASLFRAELVEKAKVGSAIVQKITQ